jgi:hypothetical protein
MNHFDHSSKKRELLAITYNSNAVFVKDSPHLTSHACHALQRVARAIHRIPQTVGVEVRSDADVFDTNGDLLWNQRFGAVKDALVRAGLEATRIRRAMASTGRSNCSEITLILTASAEPVDSMIQVQPQDAWQYGCHACS